MSMQKHSMQQHPNGNRYNTEQGFIVLTSTVIVIAIGVAIAVSLLLLGVGSTKTSFTLVQSQQAKALANACAEIALNGLRLDESYSWPGQQVIGNGTCTATLSGSGDSGRGVTASGTVGTIVRKISITGINLSPTAALIQWAEVAD